MEAAFLTAQAERLADNKRLHAARCVLNDDNGVAGGTVESVVGVDGGTAGNGGGDAPEGDYSEMVNDKHNASQLAVGGIGSHKEQSHLFWSTFRKICSHVQHQIDLLLLMNASHSETTTTPSASSLNTASIVAAVDKNKVKSHYATSTKRNEGRRQLELILERVRSLRRHCLSSSSSLAAVKVVVDKENASVGSAVENSDDKSGANKSTGYGGENDPNNNSQYNHMLQSLLHNPMPDLPQTDIRLLSSEMDNLLSRIDVAREIICPKEKFVFRRYRCALEEVHKNGVSVGGGGAKGDTGGSSELSSDDTSRQQQQQHLTSQYGGMLENKSNCTIEILADGTVKVNETTDEQLKLYAVPRSCNYSSTQQQSDQASSSSSSSTTVAASDASSYLLQNLRNTTLLIHSPLHSLHLQHIQNCKIYVSTPIIGPVHVTDVIKSEIRASCYQLRVHDSKEVRFGVWVRSGPIIEDCSGMVFEGNYYLDDGDGNEDGGSGGAGRNMFWDVKDFNWLRALRKSPNFVVVTKEGKLEEKEREGSITARPQREDYVERIVVKEPKLEEEGDSEDEL
eukprot:scaffold605_cov195-Alexandrium_tamarense.AAC.3